MEKEIHKEKVYFMYVNEIYVCKNFSKKILKIVAI